MKAKDIMTKQVITLAPESTVLEAIAVLIDNAISGAPIIDQNGMLCGIITEKDLLVVDDFLGKDQNHQVTLQEFMTKETITVTEDTDVKTIVKMLIQKNIKRVPVMRDKQLVGIVSRRDILKSIRQSNRS